MSRPHLYVRFGTYGQIIGTMRTNVANVPGWDMELNYLNETHRKCVQEGSQNWWIDRDTGTPHLRIPVDIIPDADAVEVGETNVVTLFGVPNDYGPVRLLINEKDEVLVGRLPSGSLDILQVDWDQPTPVTIRLSPKEFKLKAKPILIQFKEPSIVVGP